jgi:protein-S-isoprenylcysteine O-methyltransferase Ste14
MRRASATAATALWFVVAPGLVVVVVPWWLTGWQMGPVPAVVRIVGVVLLVAGGAVLIRAFARFVTEGRGSPVPVAPPQRLVVGGLYRYVRNPMYLAVAACIVGQAMLLGRAVLAGYAVIVWTVQALFVRVWEEPDLVRRFGPDYAAYRQAVPAWWPRRHPWSPGPDPPRPET